MAKTTATTKQKDEALAKTKVIIPCRFSYVHVFTPTAVEGSDNKKYNVSLLIKKTNPIIADIRKAIKAAQEAGNPKWKGKIPANLKLPLRDGDKDRPDNPEYKGHYFLGANSTIRPKVVDAELNEIIDPEEFYSGCYGRAAVNFYTYSAAGNNGVACGLGNLQKLKEGDPLAGGTTPEEDFGSLESGEDEDSEL
jgi:hypothetical protein